MYNARLERRKLNNDFAVLCKAECERSGNGVKDIEYVKEQLNHLHRKRYHGAVVRARAEGYLMGEQPTKRALADEKRQALRNEISEIEFNHVVTTDPKKIKQAFFKHYEKLFDHKDQSRNEIIYSQLLERIPSLPKEEREWLEQEITFQEVKRSIDDLPNAKTLGPDGLGAEFYKKFKSIIAGAIVKIFHRAYEVYFLPASFSGAYTVLLPKSDDVVKRRKVTGYRPITLCNTDYEVFAKILAHRLQSVSFEITNIKHAEYKEEQY